MGREIVAVDEVPAGNIFGIYGLEGSILKMGTLSDKPDCPSLSSLKLAVWITYFHYKLMKLILKLVNVNV